MIGAASGAGFTLGAIVVARLGGRFPWGFAFPGQWMAWAMPLAGCCLLGGLLGGAWAAFRPPSLRKAAWMVDSFHGTRDALGNAIDLMLVATISPDQRGFATLHLARAEAEAAKVNPKAVVSFGTLSKKRALRVLPVLVLAAIAAGLWLPTPTRRPVALTPEDFRTAAPMSIETQVVQDVTAAASAAAASLPQTSAKDLDSLKALEEELRRSPVADRQLSERAAGLTEQVAGRLDQAARESKATDDAMRQALQERMRQSSRGRSDLEAAMRAGDLAGAAAAAEELARQARSLPPAERAKAAEDLQRLADALGTVAGRPDGSGAGAAAPPPPQSPDGQLQASPQGEQATPSAASADRPATPSASAPRPDAPAQRPTQNDPPPAREAPSPKSPIESLRDLANKAAEELRQPPQPAARDASSPEASRSGERPATSRSERTGNQPQAPEPASGRQGDPSGGKAQSSDEKSSSGDPKSSPPAAGAGAAAPQPPAEQGPSGKAQPNRSDASQPARSSGTGGGTTPTPERVTERTKSPEPAQQGTEAPASSTKTPSKSPEPVAKPSGEQGRKPPAEPVKQLPLDADAPRQGDASPPKPAGPDGATSAQPAPQPPPQPAPQPADRGQSPPSQERPAGEQPRDAQPPSGDTQPSAVQRMAEQLRRMQQSGEESQRLTQQSESLRRQAREMLERMSPQQRQEAMRMASEAASRGDGQSGGQQGAASRPQSGSDEGAAPTPQAMPGRQAGGRLAAEGGARPTQGGNATGRTTGPVAEPRPFTQRRDLQNVSLEGVDARRTQERDPGSRTVAEWDSPPQPGGATAPAPRGQAMSEGLNEAARGAQRAIETQQVPAQYADLVRRVFRKYVERATPPPPDGPR